MEALRAASGLGMSVLIALDSKSYSNIHSNSNSNNKRRNDIGWRVAAFKVSASTHSHPKVLPNALVMLL